MMKLIRLLILIAAAAAGTAYYYRYQALSILTGETPADSGSGFSSGIATGNSGGIGKVGGLGPVGGARKTAMPPAGPESQTHPQRQRQRP